LIPSFKKTRTDDASLRQVQDSIDLVFGQIIRRKILDGVLIENVSLVSGTNIVSHTLGRPINGFLVVRRNANEEVWNSTTDRINESLAVALDASGTVTVSLWFF